MSALLSSREKLIANPGVEAAGSGPLCTPQHLGICGDGAESTRPVTHTLLAVSTCTASTLFEMRARLERLILAGPNSALPPVLRLQPHQLNSEAADRRGVARGRQQRCWRAQEAQA